MTNKSAKPKKKSAKNKQTTTVSSKRKEAGRNDGAVTGTIVVKALYPEALKIYDPCFDNNSFISGEVSNLSTIPPNSFPDCDEQEKDANGKQSKYSDIALAVFSVIMVLLVLIAIVAGIYPLIN